MTKDPRGRRVKVALYSGIVAERDAVSRSFLWKLELLQRLRDAGYAVDVTGFTQGSDYRDPDIHVVPHLGVLMHDEDFKAADLHVFEYAMWYELFNALVILDRPSLVIDHNTTPPELVSDPAAKLACEKAQRKRHNFVWATRLAADSEFTRDELVEMGLSSDPVSVLHLPPGNSWIARSAHAFSGGSTPIRLLYVGRLVAAKGINDLLDAMARLRDEDVNLHLTLAGSTQFSEPEAIAAVKQAVNASQAHGLTFVPDAEDEEIAELYRTADVFVMPSHHEGYCIPIVEALTSGCFVIGSDAGNIPTVMGGLGSVFPAGDVGALVDCIGDFARRVREVSRSGAPLLLPTSRGQLTVSEWQHAVDTHLSAYSQQSFEAGFLQILEQLGPAVDAPSGWLSGASGSDTRPTLQSVP